MALSISKLTLLATAAATFAVTGCSTSPQQTTTAGPATVTVTGSPTSTTASTTTPIATASIASATPPSHATAPTSAALTRQPCDLLTPVVAAKYVGDDARRQFTYDGHPPVPVGDSACYYTGDTREIEVSIHPRPTNPTAPINHFHVISPENRVDALGFEAYWFGPGESIVAVKDGLVISVKIANIKGDWTDQDRADDIELANLVVPRVG
jgi:hypothetical protein